ncbi:Uncharacterised protein [Mycobacteroides abscessus subsp. abscessus]|nr:Uncharacterised protein [Mycobacteroides abscessus subsp. abscessus]
MCMLHLIRPKVGAQCSCDSGHQATTVIHHGETTRACRLARPAHTVVSVA